MLLHDDSQNGRVGRLRDARGPPDIARFGIFVFRAPSGHRIAIGRSVLVVLFSCLTEATAVLRPVLPAGRGAASIVAALTTTAISGADCAMQAVLVSVVLILRTSQVGENPVTRAEDRWQDLMIVGGLTVVMIAPLPMCPVTGLDRSPVRSACRRCRLPRTLTRGSS